MNRFILSFLLFYLGLAFSVAQVGINTDGTSPNSSAGLDVKFTNKGFLPPRMTFAARNQIVSPAEGLIIFCTNCNQDGSGCISLYMGGQWINLSASCPAPATPAEGIHDQTNTQIIWNWISVPIATGYKWHTSNNYGAATDMGLNTTRTETGMIQGFCYTRYVWAYNDCGVSDPVVLQGQALNCGSSFQRLHSVGTVAPVTKTVTYGTETGIPGETSKCWITRNLGATQQPNTKDDNTEAAAGWYWQFNRMQGYMHDGVTTTPTWSTTIIDEDMDWQAENDPCYLLLGSAWRVPTYTEWSNVVNTGGWTNWNGPWNSGLQMHATGYILGSDGTLNYRGSRGYYWSSTGNLPSMGHILFFSNTQCVLNISYAKRYGLPVRCVRD